MSDNAFQLRQAAPPSDTDLLAAEPSAPEGGILATVRTNPALVLTDRKRFSEFYEAVAAQARALKPDLASAKGRGEIASMAHRIARTKTAIDDAGKKLNEAARTQIGVVDEARRHIRAELDALKDEVRKPLDDWETAEALRLKEGNEAVEWLTVAAIVRADEGIASVRERLTALESYDEQDASWQEFSAPLAKAKELARDALTEALARLGQEEADRAELARLRAEADARAEAEREAAQEAARREAQRLAAEQAEQQRVEAEKRAAERMERAKQEAADAAKREAERQARAAEEARERAHREEVAGLRRDAEAAERARQEQADKLARAEAERAAEVERIAAEDRRRAADRAHRSVVMKAAKEALMEHAAIDEETAKRVVMAITGAHVPAIVIQF